MIGIPFISGRAIINDVKRRMLEPDLVHSRLLRTETTYDRKGWAHVLFEIDDGYHGLYVIVISHP